MVMYCIKVYPVWMSIICDSHQQLPLMAETHVHPWTWGKWRVEYTAIKPLASSLALNSLSCRSCSVLQCFSTQSNRRKRHRWAGGGRSTGCSYWAAASSYCFVWSCVKSWDPAKQTLNCGFALGVPSLLSLFIPVAFCLLLTAFARLKRWLPKCRRPLG